MRELWMAFADDPTAQHLAVDGELGGRTPRQAFDDARLADALNGREITWMLLIDREDEHGQLVASYEVSLRHPSTKPTKR
jgi:hypothetical protein